jgi:hypothetical protein
MQLRLGDLHRFTISPNFHLVLTRPNDPGTDPQGGPRIGNEIGATEDTFEVYRGGVSDALDSSAVWRYVAKDCLRAPNVSAVEEFRKAIAEAERPQVPKQP